MTVGKPATGRCHVGLDKWLRTHESRLWRLNLSRRKWPLDAALALMFVTGGLASAASGARLRGLAVAVVLGGGFAVAALVERALPRHPLPRAVVPVAVAVAVLLALTAVVLAVAG